MFGAKKPIADGASSNENTPRTPFDRLLTTTPVVMTVVATLLAGLSSSEMTQAQYFRSLAAQTQSKAGDQWAFFQAKRIRGTNHDVSIKLLRAVAEVGDPSSDSLLATLDDVIQQLQNVQPKAKALVRELDVKSSNTNADRLRKTSERLETVINEQLASAQKLRVEMAKTLADPSVVEAMAYLKGTGFPTLPPNSVSADPAIDLALSAIAEHKSEKEIEDAVRAVRTIALHQAISDVQSSSKALDDAIQPLAASFARIDKLVAAQSAIARAFFQSARAMRNAVEVSSGGAFPTSAIQQLSTSIFDIARNLRESVTEKQNEFLASQMGFEARRYRRESLDNQRTAGLYDIEVRKNSFNSERHRRRSGFYFYGMLAAQLGVTIASLALAVRLRSVLWGLATTAGIVAIIIGAYVYVYI